MSWPTKSDLRMMRNMPREKLLKLFFSHLKNLWRVDGLYFLGIEESFGTEAATSIDANCWKIMGKIESRELKETLGIKKDDVTALLEALGHTTWALYQTEKESETSGDRGVFRVKRCRIQETRKKRGLSEFPCRKVRLSYLQSFTEEFNSNIEVTCSICPPSPHPEDVMCEWVFTLRK